MGLALHNTEASLPGYTAPLTHCPTGELLQTKNQILSPGPQVITIGVFFAAVSSKGKETRKPDLRLKSWTTG